MNSLWGNKNCLKVKCQVITFTIMFRTRCLETTSLLFHPFHFMFKNFWLYSY